MLWEVVTQSDSSDPGENRMPRDRVTTWKRVFSEHERRVFAAAGYGRSLRLGRRPAVLLVDVTLNFTGDRPENIFSSIKRFRNSCGPAAWESLPAVAKLARTARAMTLPLIYTRGPRNKNPLSLGGWTRTQKGTDVGDDERGESFLELIAPEASDLVLEKRSPSAFFGTPLSAILVDLKVDTLVLAGATTSGCVRATTVDAFSFGYRVAIVEEATFDRSELSRAVSLFEMNSKYGEVISVSRAIRYLRRSAGLSMTR